MLINGDKFLASYIETALWSSTDDAGINLDDSKYEDTELADQTREQMTKDCGSFIQKTASLIAPSTQVAHDFWLTRNRHGAGFWDGDYPEPLGKQLTDIAHGFGECDLCVGDDGKFYLS